jgi:hypothetical protein
MAYLNKQERQDLLNQLKDMSFNGAKGKLRRMDPKGKLAYIRNSQQSGKLITCFNLEGLGTRVYLIEELQKEDKDGKIKAKFIFTEVAVEAMPENRT